MGYGRVIMVKKNTYEGFSIKKVKTYDDKRGTLYEALRFKTENVPGDGQIYVYTVEPGARRGDHYHKNKEEWFLCVSGKLELLIKTQKRKFEKKISSDSPEVVYVAPGTVHTLINRTKNRSVVIAYASKELDRQNPDTHKVSEI